MHLCILATLFSALSAASSLCWHDKDYRCQLNWVIPLYLRCIMELKQTCVHIRNAHTNNIHFWVNWYKCNSGLIGFGQLLMPWWMCVCVVTYLITLRACVRAWYWWIIHKVVKMTWSLHSPPYPILFHLPLASPLSLMRTGGHMAQSASLKRSKSPGHSY